MDNPKNLDEFKKWAGNNLGKELFLQYEKRKAVNKVVRISKINSSSLFLVDENESSIRIPFPKKGHYRFYQDTFRLSTWDFRYDTSGPKPRGRRRSAELIGDSLLHRDLNHEIESLLSMYPVGHAFKVREKKILAAYQIPSSSYIQVASQIPQSTLLRMWDLAFQFGLQDSSKVLDPAAGIGMAFSDSRSQRFDLYAVEPNKNAARILRILYPGVKLFENEFSSLIMSTLDPKTRRIVNFPGFPFDLVIGVPPTGSWTAVRDLDEVRRTHANGLSDYYLSRSLDLLKPGGLLVMVLRQEQLSSGKSFLELGTTSFRKGIDTRAELLDAFRLPTLRVNKENINSDLVIYRKNK
jgi:hypothetical protein